MIRRDSFLLLLLLASVVPVANAEDAVAVERRVQQMVAAIDRRIESDWLAHNLKPAAVADDSEYARRIYLDLIGRIPKVGELTEFADDKSADKRAKLVEKLLNMPAHARHFASGTRNEWLPQTQTDIRFVFLGTGIELWLRERYRQNTPASEVVSRLLSVKLGDGASVRFRNGQIAEGDTESQQLLNYYTANEVRPDQLAASVSRVFLGVKLECAQCHDHPFAPHTKEQFWQLAAFFGEFSPLPAVAPSFVGPLPPQFEKNQITIPNTENTIIATYFDGTFPEWNAKRLPRQELAVWLTSPENPYFARNLANRMWARFFGIGLIDPIDEPGDNNPPSHPELLDELAKGFAESGFDNRVLIRAIVRSKPYQLTSKLTHPTQNDPRRFARMAMKGLSGAQIYDSFIAATGMPNDATMDSVFFDVQAQTPRGRFVKQFPTGGKVTESQTSILQALMMMNGTEMAQQTTIQTGQTLTAIVDAPFLTTETRIDALYRAVVCRSPTAEEREKFASYVDRGGPSGDKTKALADVMWVLLNSTEFLFNH